MKTTYTFVVFTTWIIVNGVSKKDDCPKLCFCNSQKLEIACNSRRLKYIPKLPSYVEKTKFIQNSFPYINVKFFENLTTFNQITVLNLTNNLTKNTTNDAFLDFHNLSVLDISREPNLPQRNIIDSLQSLKNTAIKKLYFTNNGWESILPDMFSSPTLSSVITVSFASNAIKVFDATILSPLKELQILDLSNNNLLTVSLTFLSTLTHLYLRRNDISNIPIWCSNKSESYLPNLIMCDLESNAISVMTNKSFQCLRKLQYLKLNINNMRFIENNTFSSLTNLATLHLSNLARLEKIHDTGFNVSSLKYFYFQHNRFHFDKGAKSAGRYNPNTLFKNCPNLLTLDLSNNFLPYVKKYVGVLEKMLAPLTKLKKLTLPNTHLKSLPLNTLPKMKSLTLLNLQGNYINSIEDGERTFGNKSSIKLLNLQANYIRLVNSTTFPSPFLSGVEALDLSDNPFSCTCELKWFRDWIRDHEESGNKNKSKLLRYPKGYVCMFPSYLKGELLQNYNPTDETCTEKNLTEVSVAVILTTVVGITILFAVLYRCQNNIRNYIYLIKFHRKRRNGYINLEGTEYSYDVFIVYSDRDRKWVHDVLVKLLERENARVCIHHRDFDLGVPVTANIGKYMGMCRKIIVVMTNSFAESEWCQWEVDLVQERRRQQGKEVSVLLMLENIDSNHMTDSLKTLLDITPQLRYSSGIGERVFWKALLKWTRKPLGQPPMAVLFTNHKNPS